VEADAVFTHAPGAVVAVTMADCLAALVVDPASGCVAAVHAGWRGSRDNILGRALERLFAEGRCRPESTRVALGPCLSVDALEVGEDVAATLPPEHVLRVAGTPRFDLRGCNRAQARAAGVPAEHIADIGGCTRGDASLYFSHRRDAGVTGRMAACVVLA
jgi:YfiH family protein